ncbi:MAG: hypothetical protein GY699_17215 [Desulfobacteraceae bacterium]|nr:hypothetical protein [Desulfobacteraceae bacterium]
MSKIGLIVLGWILGILSTLFARWLQTKEEKKKKELEIISETLKYLFKIRQTYNNLVADTKVTKELSKKYPEKAPVLEAKMLEAFNKDIANDFFPNLIFHSFQLKRLKDQSFWQDFEYLMNKYDALTEMTLGKRKKENYSERNKEMMDLMKNFIDKSIAKTKV